MTTPTPRLRAYVKWAALLLSFASVGSAQISWTNSAGGNWSSADNWDPNQVPVSSDSVSINLNGDYTVNLNVAASVDSLNFAAASGSQVFSIPSHTLTLKSDSTFGANCQLSLRTGEISITGGTLSLLGGVVSSNGTLDVTAAATVNLTGGNTVNWAGQINGIGKGKVLFGAGSIDSSPALTLAFTNNLFQWEGGTFAGTVTNAGTINLAGSAPSILGNGASFFNDGTVTEKGSGGLVLNEAGGRPIFFDNLPGATYQIETDSPIYAENCCASVIFENQGLLWKSGGSGNTTISVTYNNLSGTNRVDNGLLTLANNGVSSNGDFVVAAGASVDLTGGFKPTWGGEVTGSGAGQVLTGTGTVVGSPNLNLNFPQGVFQWAGGALAGSLQNTGYVTVSGTNDSVLANGGLFLNSGLVQQTGTGYLDFNEAGGDPITFNNLAGGTYEFTSDSGLQAIGCCAAATFNNQGLLWKSLGTNTTIVGVIFDNENGAIQVDSGTLSVGSAGGNSINGSFSVAAKATLDLTGGGGPSWVGQITGHGAGRVLLGSGQLNTAPGLTLNFPQSLFQWTGGTLAGTVSNIGSVTLSGINDSVLGNGALFINSGLVQQTGTGYLDFNEAGGDSITFNNLPGGTYEFDSDSGLQTINCCAAALFNNQGLVRKFAGTNSSIGVTFNNLGGTIEVDAGSLVFVGGGVSSNANLVVASGATLDLTGGSSPVWQGELTGSGSGQVVLSHGTISAGPLTLGFTNSMFQWEGGTFAGTVTNSGMVILTGSAPSTLGNGASFFNNGMLVENGSGGLVLNEAGGLPIFFDNLPGATYQIETDSSIYPENCCASVIFENQGLLWKSGGASNTTISVTYNNLSGTNRVDNGLLTLANNGVSSNGDFVVAAGTSVDLTGGFKPIWAGEMTGSGAGQVLSGTGTVVGSPNLNLNFPQGVFQWAGGTLAGSLQNTGYVTVSGTNDSVLADAALFVNSGTVQQTGTGYLDFNEAGGVAIIFNNLAGGTYEFDSDSGLQTINCCAAALFNNQGLVRKFAGSNTSIGVTFNNLGGTIEVDAGTLVLAGGGGSSNANLVVSSGATLDLTGGSSPVWQGELTGSGGGQVVLSHGTISAGPLTLGFTNTMFQWAGGTFAGTVTNNGIVAIAGTNTSTLANAATFVNNGLLQETGTGGLVFNEAGGSPVLFENLSNATFRFAGDGSVAAIACCSAVTFDSQGLVWKSGGTNTSSISVTFNNLGGAMEVDTGTLSLGGNNYQQGGGGLTIGIAGQSAGQHGLLALTGAATLNGPLDVVLAEGFVPLVGSQFQILSAGSLTGTFSTLTLPPSFVVNYSNTSVYVTYTGAPTFVISASNNPPAAGSVANTGVFIVGTTNMLTAQPNYGYAFSNWTQSGAIVGTNEVLTNVVTANAAFVANYAATNLTHIVTGATSPEGVAAILGAGTYNNGVPVTISAPTVVTAGQDLYTFQYFTRNGFFSGSNNVINTSFSTTNRPNIQFVAVYGEKPLHPQVVHVTANYASPVPKTTNFIFQMQFDRTMNTAISPTLNFTNAAPGAVQPKVGNNGQWSTSVYPSDTYATPPITFGTGMDGTVQVLASGAQDTNGYKLVSTNILTLAVFSTPPVVTLSSPTNGALFTTTNAITISASASSIYALTNLTIYNGTNALATTTATSLTLTTNGLTAGSYPLFAVATDANGTSATSLVSHVTLSLPGTTLIDFEALDATAGPVTNAPLIKYLARYGVSFLRSTNTMLAVENDQNILDGTVTVASSGVNLLTQIGTNGAIAYTLKFNQPYQSVHWTRTEMLAGSAGAILPEWRAHAYDSNGVEVASVGEKQIGSYTNIPAAPFTLAGTNIASVTFFADNTVGPLNSLPLDDLLLSTFPPGANIGVVLSAAAGTNYTAPGQITLTARATETGGVINQIEFYEADNLLGSVPTTFNASLGLTNVAAGTYTFTVVASDGTFTRSSAPLTVNVAAAAGITVINFDALDATSGSVGGILLSNYLSPFGIKLANGTLGTRLEVVNENNLSGSAVAVPSSPPNLFTQAGLNTPVRFWFVFKNPLESFGFTRVGLVAGSSGVSHPAWTASALDASGKVLETASEPLIFSFDDVPARLFQLTGNNIARVRFDSDSEGTASFSAVLLDDLVLDTNTVANALSITLDAPKGSFSAGDDITLTASVIDTLGGLATVSFYDGINLIGSVAGGSGIVWTNVQAGPHNLSAQLSDSTGYTVSSGTVRVTVNSLAGVLTPVLVNFDSLNAATASVTGATLASYLSAAGMEVTNISAGTKLAVENQALINGGGFVIASSPSNILTQIGSNKTVNFTLSFSPLLTQFAFTRPELEANPFVSEPAWEGRAYDPLGVLVAQTSEGLVSSYSNVPAQPFALRGASIATVEFISHGSGLTTFDSLVMDDFILTTSSNLPPSVLLTNPLPSQTFTAPALIVLEAEAVAAKGTVTNVNFYFAGTNLVGTAAVSPYLFYWTNPPPASYSLTAVAADSSGLLRTSPPVSITVNPAASEFGILTQPVGETVAAGGSATLDVVTTGTNAVTYQWFQNGVNLAGQTDSVLNLNPLRDFGAGTYTVIATSGTLSLTSQGAVLIVLNAPAITSAPASQQAQIGDSVTLTVGATGSPPLNYQWLLNGTGIDGATNSSLDIPVAQPLNSGDYQVIVGNPVGFAESPIAVVSVTVAGGMNESADFFSNRISIDPLVGPVFGENTNATLEAGEPLPDGKPGGKSIWYTWHAGFDGVISLTTQGSSFDTLLAVYTGTNLAKLTPVAEDDDSGGFFTSLVTFNCVAGTDYQIDVDGFRGAAGQVVLGLPAGTGYRVLSISSGDTVPVITHQPTNQVVPAGATVTLNVTATSPTPLTYQWFFQNAPIAGASSHTLILTNFLSGSVGAYYALVANSVGSIPSTVANLQIAAQSHGSSISADDKFGDAVDLSLAAPASGGHSGATPTAAPRDEGGDSAGYSVAQVFSTVGATKEPGEPDPCGQTGGASEWYIYFTPAAGTFHLDTTGSDFNTLVGIFTNAGPVLAFSSLVELGCGYTTNYALDGQPSINLPDVPAGTELFITVDGYQGASGVVQLNLGLGAPPAILTQPQSRPAVPGGSAEFSVRAVGTTNLYYQWQLDGAGIAGANNSSFTVSNAQVTAVGNYSVIVSNVVNVVTSAPAALSLQSTPFIFGQPASQAVNVGQSTGFSVAAGGVTPLSYQWYFNGAPVANATGTTLAVPATKFGSEGSYTVVVNNSLGSVTSSNAVLTVSETTKPTLEVTYPPGNITTNSSSITLRGTASDVLDVTSVQLLVNSNLQIAAGTTNWSAAVALQVGVNYVTVQSHNVSDLSSLPVSRTITYVVTSPLTLQTNGSGRITGETNQAQLQIAKAYSVTATPAPNFLFSNWTGRIGVLGTNPALSFIMATNLLLQANFVTNPFPAVAGVYHGLFYPSNGVTEQSSGFITITLSPSLGRYTADILLAGGGYGFTGGFDLTGNSRTSFIGPGRESVTVVLGVGLNLDPPANQITGTVSAGEWQSELTADRAVFNGTTVKATNYAARYTLIVPPGSGAPVTSPGGYGVATITNNLAGVATLTGTLGDGTPIYQNVAISENGVIPVYVSRYAGEELLLGWITFTNVPPQTLSGVLNWIKIPGAIKPLYTGGFSNESDVVASFYQPNGLTMSNGTLTISGAAQATNLVYTNVNVSGGKLSYSGAGNPTNQLSAAFTASTGAMTLTFRPTGARADVVAQGVVLQLSDTNAAGWFLGTNESGYFLLQP
jgi:hypothetical protein